MTKNRRDLPDLRPKVYSFPEGPDEKGRVRSPPSDVDVRDLAERHHFPADFDLVKPLEDRWFWWRADSQIGSEPSGAIRRDFLRELARRADAFAEAVLKAGIAERRLMFDVIPPSRLDLEAVERGARNVAHAARVAERQVAPSRRGARGDAVTIELLCKLWRVYIDAFGSDAPKISRVGNEYSGPFFDFSRDVLRLFGGRNHSNNSLGKLIEKAQRTVAEREAVKNHQSPELG